MSNKSKVRWTGDSTFEAQSSAGHTIAIQSTSGNSQQSVGPSPMELILLGAGGCVSTNVVSILKKSRVGFTDLEVELSGQRAADPPRVFTQIHLHFLVTGHKLKSKTIARSIELAIEKYCSATNMLAKAVEIEHSFDLIEHSVEHST